MIDSTMRNLIQQLARIAEELIILRVQVAREALENGRAACGGFEETLLVIHRSYDPLFTAPEALLDLALQLSDRGPYSFQVPASEIRKAG